MQFRKSLALTAVLVGMSLTGVAHAASPQAVAMKTYTNKAHGYSLSYPSTWSVKPNADSSDVEFKAHDTNALVTASASKGSLSVAVIKAQQAKVLKGMGAAQGPLSYKSVSINGVTYELTELVVKTKAGKLLDAVLLDTSRGGKIYDFEAFLIYNGPTYKAETTLVQEMLNSIKLS